LERALKKSAAQLGRAHYEIVTFCLKMNESDRKMGYLIIV